jgi:vitamin B12 transporter
MRVPVSLLCLSVAVLGRAQTTVNLPEVTVYSPRVANQSPAGTFAMPVSPLRYEPRVDLQARNLTEGQADVTIRGGIFETTGFQVGAVTLLDPQTGHYFAEIPVAPALLAAPEILTGADLAVRASNANVGAITYGWRPIRTTGAAAVGAGEFGLWRGELYQGFASDAKLGDQKVGVDFALAHSESDGPFANAEHRFDRVNGRLQLASANAQTDFFAGYQAKFFGWPNLYTPFNSNETEDLETVLFAINHRLDLGGGKFVEAGVYHRRNKDDYAFNRFAVVPTVHPFQHTTRVNGAALGGRVDAGSLTVNFRGEVLSDDLDSTSLTFGRYSARTLTKLAFVPERTWRAADGSATTLKLGATFDDSSRDDGAFSPTVELARTFSAGAARRVYASYAKTTQVPSYTALNSNPNAGLFRGNPNLGREISHNVEVGVSGTFAGWMGQAALFWRRDESLVDWTFRRNVVARFANPVDIDTAGFEAMARRSWANGDVVLGYTALGKDENYRGVLTDGSFYALNFARHRLTAAVTVRFGEGFELRIDNVVRIQQSNPLRSVGGDEAVFTSLGLAYRPRHWRGVEVSVLVDNLWDSDFQEVPAVFATPRQFSGGVSYRW